MSNFNIPPKRDIPEALQFHPWWGPDPALRFIFEHGDPEFQRAAMAQFVNYNVATSAATAQFWTGLQGMLQGKVSGF
jgi:hypothetical protein